MKLKGELIDDAQAVLGPAGESEFSVILVSSETYRAVSEQAKKEGTTSAQVFQKAILQYLHGADEGRMAKQEMHQTEKPDIVVRRRR